MPIPPILRVRISQLSESPLDINLISSYSFCCFQLGHDVAPVDWGNRPHCSHISSPGVNEVSHNKGTIVIFIENFIRPKKFPPGPINFPLVGSLPYVDVRNISKSFKKLRKK